jgi:hypothetical protein
VAKQDLYVLLLVEFGFLEKEALLAEFPCQISL